MSNTQSTLNMRTMITSGIIILLVLIGIGMLLPSKRVISSYATVTGGYWGDYDNNNRVDISDLFRMSDDVSRSTTKALTSTDVTNLVRLDAKPRSFTKGNISTAKYMINGTPTSAITGDDVTLLAMVLFTDQYTNAVPLYYIAPKDKIGTEYSTTLAVAPPATSTTTTMPPTSTTSPSSTTLPPSTTRP